DVGVDVLREELGQLLDGGVAAPAVLVVLFRERADQVPAQAAGGQFGEEANLRGLRLGGGGGVGGALGGHVRRPPWGRGPSVGSWGAAVSRRRGRGRAGAPGSSTAGPGAAAAGRNGHRGTTAGRAVRGNAHPTAATARPKAGPRYHRRHAAGCAVAPQGG